MEDERDENEFGGREPTTGDDFTTLVTSLGLPSCDEATA